MGIAAGAAYRPRDAAGSALYRCILDHLETYLAARSRAKGLSCAHEGGRRQKRANFSYFVSDVYGRVTERLKASVSKADKIDAYNRGRV